MEPAEFIEPADTLGTTGCAGVSAAEAFLIRRYEETGDRAFLRMAKGATGSPGREPIDDADAIADVEAYRRGHPPRTVHAACMAVARARFPDGPKRRWRTEAWRWSQKINR
jgi:hypothetical protein